MGGWVIFPTMEERHMLNIILQQSKNSKEPVRAIHDAVATAYLIEPSIFKSEIIPIKIDLLKTKGQTLIDEKGTLVNVIRSIDKKEFVELMCHLLNNLN